VKMPNINYVIVAGHLGADPILRQTQNGTSVASLSIATSYKSGEREHTEWHRIVVWEKQADNCAKYLKKGSAALVIGRLQTQEYTDKDNIKRWKTEIVAQSVQFLGGKQTEETQKTETETRILAEDVPF